VNKRPVGGRRSEASSHPTDMKIMGWIFFKTLTQKKFETDTWAKAVLLLDKSPASKSRVLECIPM
jgi:hypothetical protein